MWVVVVGIIPLIIEWANLKYEISDVEKKEKYIKGFAWAGFSVIFYFIVLTSGRVSTIELLCGAIGSIALGKWVSSVVCDLLVKINCPKENEVPVNEIQIGVSVFTIGLGIFIVGLLFALLA